MAHNNTAHRRILASPDLQPPMDPTQRKPKPNPSSSAASKNHRLRHPLADPAVASPPSTIQNISHRFSKLYANHKKLVSKPGPHPQPDPHSQTRKDPPFPPVSNSSCTTLTKSSSHKEKNRNFDSAMVKILEKNEKIYYLGTKPNAAKGKDSDFNKPASEKDPIKNLLSLEENDAVMRGFEEGLGEGKRRSSLSSSIPPVVNGGGRRRSFCSSQVELADFLSSSGVRVVAVDMPPFMQVHAVDCARKVHDSLEKFTSKTLAFTLKKEFDGVYGPAWHCIVGTSFGSFVTHSVGGFMYFSMDHKLYILLFKTTVQRAE